MEPFATSHFSHDALLHDLKTLDGQDRRTAAVLLSRIVEVEDRGLFLREGYPSMHAYCIQGLHWCEGTASRRIYAARAARRFPVLFDAVADGRLHLTAVLMLSRHLTSGNVDELVAAATHRSRAEIERLIAERFPQPHLPEVLQAIGPPPTPVQTMTAPHRGEHSPENVAAPVLSNSPLAPGPTPQHSPENVAAPVLSVSPLAPGPAPQHSPENAVPPAPRTELKPLAPQRFGFQCTLDQETYDLLQQARALMGHQNPSGEIVPVLKRALALLVGHLEKQKFAATTRPGRARPSASARHIPAAVKRAVRERDGERCAFVSEGGNRCTARTRLEFDHQEPVARGGEATTENIRLLCASHNAYAAERAFGTDFMERKRWEARERG